jgi:hypothetical protein
VSSALLVPDDRALDGIPPKLNQFGTTLTASVRSPGRGGATGSGPEDYEQFIKVAHAGGELIRAGRATQGREVQLTQAGPLADRLERRTNELRNKAEADMVARSTRAMKRTCPRAGS